jgi:hypothetical protein
MNHILSSLALLLPGANGPGVSPKLSKAMLERAIALHCTCLRTGSNALPQATWPAIPTTPATSIAGDGVHRNRG